MNNPEPVPELKPCPFCGEVPIVDCSEDHSEAGKDTWLVCCGSMCCYGNAFTLDNSFYSRKHACEAWNTRIIADHAPKETGATALKPGAALLCKLASVAVHADEMLSAKGHTFDRHALLSALGDEEVKDWIKQMTEMGMAPVKR